MILGSNPCFVATPPYLTYLHSSNGVSKLNKVSKFRARSTGEIPHQETRRCECYDLHNELIPYYKAWNWQKSIMRKRHDLVKLEKDYSDTVIILQHPSVYTLGTGSSKEYLKFDIDNAPYDIYRTERGGEVTYHGPGQLVMYPIINLNYHEKDIDKYLRKLEDVIIQALSSTFSIRASRLKGFTGVWVGDYKLAAIGIGASRWITYHGLALNITTDLSPFELIVPCGIRNRQVGSIEGILKEGSSTGTGIDTPSDACQLLEITYKSLLKQFSEVFQLSLDHKPVSELMLL